MRSSAVLASMICPSLSLLAMRGVSAGLSSFASRARSLMRVISLRTSNFMVSTKRGIR